MLRILKHDLKESLIWAIKNIVPKYYFNRTIKKLKNEKGDEELNLLSILCNPEKMSLDIGASMGLYSFHMIAFSKTVIAFEARPKQAKELSKMFAISKQKLSVESVGLSNKNGETIIRVLSKDPGRSTIEDENTLKNINGSKEEKINIKIKKLDVYNLGNVGFVKIDVEGHELAVLQGSVKTISENMPCFVIEIEERHKANAVNNVTSFLEKFGYTGFFILNNELVPINDFSIANHQNVNNVGNWTNNYKNKGVYINNFIFIPNERQSELIDSGRRLLQN